MINPLSKTQGVIVDIEALLVAAITTTKMCHQPLTALQDRQGRA